MVERRVAERPETTEFITCPGCGLVLTASGWRPTRKLNASPECTQVRDEVVGFEMAHPGLVRSCHQLTVDAYGAHAGEPTPRIYVAYSLVGLYLALERGVLGTGVRKAHQLMGKPTAAWPEFAPATGRAAAGQATPSPATLTVLDVARAGARAGSVAGHATAVREWANAVWATWYDHHAAVAALADRLLRADVQCISNWAPPVGDSAHRIDGPAQAAPAARALRARCRLSCWRDDAAAKTVP